MRKVNTIIAHVSLLLFLAHSVLGAFNLSGIGSLTTQKLARVTAILIIIHIVLGLILTVQTMIAKKKAGGVEYRDENRLFWARRDSGLAVAVLLLFHVLTFTGVSESNFRLPEFTSFRLAANVLLVVAVGVHVITNVRPGLIALGVKKLKPKVADIVFCLSVLLLFMAAAFIIYYIRWVSV